LARISAGVTDPLGDSAKSLPHDWNPGGVVNVGTGAANVPGPPSGINDGGTVAMPVAGSLNRS
jgi:hypothetical protein